MPGIGWQRLRRFLLLAIPVVAAGLAAGAYAAGGFGGLEARTLDARAAIGTPDSALQPVPHALAVLIIAAAALTPPALSLTAPPLRAFGVALVVGIAYLVAAQLAYRGGVELPVALPILALALSATGTLVVQLLAAMIERDRWRARVVHFLGSDALEEAAWDDHDGLLPPREGECTVLVAHAAGLSAFAENSEPGRAIEGIDRHRTQIRETVLAHGGAVTTEGGSEVTAVFGAPIPRHDAAERALAAAREIVEERMPRFNRWLRWRARGDAVRIGIGLSTGVVVTGAVGPDQCLEYVAAGETVDLGAGLAERAVQTPEQILLAESTQQSLPRREELTRVDEVEMPGGGRTSVYVPGVLSSEGGGAGDGGDGGRGIETGGANADRTGDDRGPFPGADEDEGGPGVSEPGAEEEIRA